MQRNRRSRVPTGGFWGCVRLIPYRNHEPPGFINKPESTAAPSWVNSQTASRIRPSFCSRPQVTSHSSHVHGGGPQAKMQPITTVTPSISTAQNDLAESAKTYAVPVSSMGDTADVVCWTDANAPLSLTYAELKREIRLCQRADRRISISLHSRMARLCQGISDSSASQWSGSQ